MIRQFLKDAGIYMIPGVISRGLTFFLLPLYTRALGPAEYGMLDLFLIIGSLINVTIALEVNQGLSFYHAQSKEEGERRSYASTAFWFTLFCYGAFLVLCMFFARPLATLIVGHEGAAGAFRLAVIYMFFQGIFLFLQNQLRWELRSRDYAISHITMTLVTTAGVVLGAFVLKAGLTGILYGLIAGVVAATALSLVRLLKTLLPVFNRPQLREMLGYSLPLVPASLCVFLSLYVDRAMINYMLTLEDVGIYAAGARIAVMFGSVLSGVNIALTPLILKHHKEPETPAHIARIFHACFAVALVLFFGLYLFVDELFWLMTTPEFFSARMVTPWLVAATLLANMYIFTPGIFLAKKTHLVLWINVGGVVSNILLNLLLIPHFGIVGAGIATAAAALLTFLLYLHFNQRTYPLALKWPALAMAIGAVLLFGAPKFLLGDGAWQDFGLRLVLFMAGTVAIVKTGLIPLPPLRFRRQRRE